MKKCIRSGILLAMLVAVLPWQAVMAQDFNALLDAVAKFDAELKELVQQESQQRSEAISGLQQSINDLKAVVTENGGAAGTPTDYSAQITGLTTAIIEMKADLLELKGQKDQSHNDELSQELILLKAELAAMQEQLRKDRPALVSIDPASYALAMPRNDVLATEVESSLGGIEWSGFFDVVGGFQSSADDETEFGLGQLEVDLASKLADNVAIEAAIAYNADDGLFEVGAALIDIHFFGSDGGHVRQGFGIDHSFLVAGQFDVPFGIDYHVYPSPDRKLVTGPMVVDMTHGDWNDVGFQFGIEASHGNFVFYMVNGFEASVEVIDEAATLATGIETMEEVETTPANAIGTRLGIAPFSWLEVGTSLATGWNVSGQSEMALVGMDLQFAMAGFELKGEYIAHSVNRTIAEENNRGYYAQATYNILDRAFVTTRYGSVKPEGSEWIGQISIGAGYNIADALGLRIETVINESSDNNQTILQMVAGF